MRTSLLNQIFHYTLKYAEACNKLAGPISASLHPSNTAPFEEMLQWWRAVGNIMSNLQAQDLNLRPPTPKTRALSLDQQNAKI